jgi:predicted nucleic acid-binding protein
MNIVSDTNIFLAVALEEPEREDIIRISTGADIFAPEILPYEIGNALSSMVKRKRLTQKEALSAQKNANQIPVRLVSIDNHLALKLAFDFNIYAYDAYFLQCAKSLSQPILTLDRRMKQIALNLKIDVME